MTARRHDPSVDCAVREAAPPSRLHDPTAVVSFPPAPSPKQHHQQAASYRGGEDAQLFKTRLPALVGRLHALGVKPTAELLIEHVGDDIQARNDLLLLLERYARLSPEVVQAVGADVFPPAVFAVGST